MAMRLFPPPAATASPSSPSRRGRTAARDRHLRAFALAFFFRITSWWQFVDFGIRADVVLSRRRSGLRASGS
eukprot:6201901-Pleurochrysis_carterae.AAC.1